MRLKPVRRISAQKANRRAVIVVDDEWINKRSVGGVCSIRGHSVFTLNVIYTFPDFRGVVPVRIEQKKYSLVKNIERTFSYFVSLLIADVN